MDRVPIPPGRPDSLEAAWDDFERRFAAEQDTLKKIQEDATNSVMKTLAANNASYAAIANGQAKAPNGKTKEEVDDSRVANLRQQLLSAAPAIVQKLVVMAVGGDITAARVILERVVPVLRPAEMPMCIDLGGNNTEDRAEAIFTAITSGRIGAETGARLLASMASIQEARAQGEFNNRVAALEAKAEAMNNARTVGGADAPLVLRIPANNTRQ